VVDSLADGKAVFINVLPPETFEKMHIEGSKNACIYEHFPQHIDKLGLSDKNTLLITYGYSSQTVEAKVAAERLMKEGYTNVAYYKGGLRDWLAEGKPIVGGVSEVPSLNDYLKGQHHLELETKESVIRWTGRRKHFGTLHFTKGSIQFKDGKVERGSSVLDMNSIEVKDLTDATPSGSRVARLKSGDHFDVENYRSAALPLLSATPISEPKSGDENYKLRMDLTLKGQTQPVEFAAMMFVDAKERLLIQAQFEFDRGQWGVGAKAEESSKIGDKIVSEPFTLEVKLWFKTKKE
jgi:rhodanese-related sulfurtransferase/polyisoprenoid-binding protein YceI